MPRMGRIVLPNYPHHVVQRGHNRQVVPVRTEGYFWRQSLCQNKKGRLQPPIAS